MPRSQEGDEELTEAELLARMAEDLREIRNIVRAWWWLVWIGVAVVFVGAILNSANT